MCALTAAACAVQPARERVGHVARRRELMLQFTNELVVAVLLRLLPLLHEAVVLVALPFIFHVASSKPASKTRYLYSAHCCGLFRWGETKTSKRRRGLGCRGRAGFLARFNALRYAQPLPVVPKRYTPRARCQSSWS